MQSENECHDGKNSFADAEHTFSLFRRYMTGGANSHFFWNMVLQPGGKSSWGWAQNAMITVDSKSQQIEFHPEYYVMKHISHFVPPKSHMIACTGSWGDKIAFVKPDGTSVLIIGNTANRAYEITIGTSDNTAPERVTLPGHSFNTFEFTASAGKG